MITDPEKYIPYFAKAGADYISVHVEGLVHIHRALSLIKSFGIKAGIALNPATPLNFAYESAEHCDYILLMAVDPGFGGQKFIPSFLRRSEKIKRFLTKNGYDHVEIEVDGGVKYENVADIVSAGANMVVAGSGLFKGDLVENIKQLKIKAQGAIIQDNLFEGDY
jgi:ribulose-phosphate 3-epimerase